MISLELMLVFLENISHDEKGICRDYCICIIVCTGRRNNYLYKKDTVKYIVTFFGRISRGILHTYLIPNIERKV